MNALHRFCYIELVTIETITARLDLYPQHLTRTVLETLSIAPVRTNLDDRDWYFWSGRHDRPGHRGQK